MGFPAGYTIAIGIPETVRHKIPGACMDCNIGTWLFKGLRRIHPSNKTNDESSHLSSSQVYNDLWIVDGGATHHFTGHKSDFNDYHDIQPTLIHGMNLNVVGTRTVCFGGDTTARHRIMRVPNVLYVPDMMDSPTKITRLYSHKGDHDTTYGYPTFIYTKDKAWLEFDDFNIDLNVKTNRNLCTLQTVILPPSDELGLITVAPRPMSKELLHRRLGHISEGGMEKIARHVNGISMKQQPLKFCEACAITKSTRIPSGN